MDLEALIAAVYAAVLDPSALQSMFVQIQEAFTASAAAILVRDKNYALTRIRGTESRVEAEADYAKNWARRNPFETSTMRLPAGALSPVTLEMPFDTLRRLAFYNDYLCKHDMPHILTLKIQQSRDGSAVLNLLRDSKAGAFEQSQLDLAQRLMTHLGHAAAMAQRIGHDGLPGASTEMIDAIAAPLAVLDLAGKLLHLNSAGRRLIQAGDGLRIAGHGLQVARASQAALDRSIARAVGAPGQPPMGGSLLIERPSGKRPYSVVIIPLKGQENLFVPRRAGALLTIVDPEDRSTTPLEALQAAYGLTVSESRVAAGIGAGHDLARVADDLGITVDSGRQYLQRVFRKTETSRQGELVRLLTLMRTLSG